MDTELLVQYGETIGYALVGALGLIGLLVIYALRRRGDLKRAQQAVRFASLSLNVPRIGPTAISATYRKTPSEQWLESSTGKVALDDAIEVMVGTSARWRRGVRTYVLNDGDEVVAIGVMSKATSPPSTWRLSPSTGEPGVKLLATKPMAAPAPMWPWRAPFYLALCGGLAFGALYGVGTILVDVPRGSDIKPCNESAVLRFQISAAVPIIRDQALDELAKCPKR